MIKVVQLQNSPYSAGRAALRLHDAFLEENFDSSMVSLHQDINDTEKMIHLKMSSNIIAWLDNKMQLFLKRKNNKEYGLYSFPILGTNVSRIDQIRNADIIYLNWVQFGFLNLSNIEQLAKLGKPMIIIMHDMWSITGGCHHSFECEKYKTGCNNCQMFPDNKIIDWPAKEFKKKLKFYSKYKNLNFVSPSKWLYNCITQALLTKDKPVFYIPNIIDNKLFKPFDKNIARQILNLDIDETILLFGAASIDSPYKGWKYLEKALELLHQSQSIKKISILLFGSGYDKKIANAIPFKTRFMGFLRDEYSTALVYNAADIFLIPSLADNQPTTVMESMCCGTPVVGFDVGGIPDMIKHKENGYLAKYKDAEDIANGIKYCLENNLKGKMLPLFEKNNIIRKHKELIESLVFKVDN
jgi:glycosyltransferase involved in cell wall biosynthesis